MAVAVWTVSLHPKSRGWRPASQSGRKNMKEEEKAETKWPARNYSTVLRSLF